jgi:hypothetical protein
MKNLIYIKAIFLLALLSFSACKDNSNSPSDSQSINQNITAGNWVITYYWDDGKEETSDYSGYEFKFDANGVAIVSGNSETISGTWSSGTDDSRLKLYLIFSSPSLFEKISDDWHIIEQSSTKIRLGDESGGDGSTDYLTFERK